MTDRQWGKVLRSIIAGLFMLGVAGPAIGQITPSGDVFFNPPGMPPYASVTIGVTSAGTLSLGPIPPFLTSDTMTLGEGLGSIGTVNVNGPGTVVDLKGIVFPPSSILPPLVVGAWGTGTMTIGAGAIVNAGSSNPSCLTVSCTVMVGALAGGTGTLMVTGTGAQLNVGGFVQVGTPAVVVPSPPGPGTAGGTATGTVRIESGGVITSRGAQLGVPGAAGANERSVVTVIVDGPGSAWNLNRNLTLGGTQTLLSASSGLDSNSSITVRNGGKIRLDGSQGGGQSVGVNLATGGPASRAGMRIDGAGSRLEFTGSSYGFLNIGTQVGGGAGVVGVVNGGAIIGEGTNGLTFASVGRLGATGVLTVDGSDASGNASLLRLAGKNEANSPFPNAPARMSVGLDGGYGLATVSRGGRIEVDTRGAGPTSGNPFINVGIGPGSNGTLTIAGTNPFNFAPSTAIVYGDNANPFVGIGRAGAVGTVDIIAGGKLELQGTGPNGATQQTQNPVNLVIGAASAQGYSNATGIGTVNVSGSGSRIELTGTSDNFIQVGQGVLGSNEKGIGTLNVSEGAGISSKLLLVGNNDGIGTLNVSRGLVELSGAQVGGPGPTGASLFAGRGPAGVATVNLANQSTMTVSSNTPNASINLGGSMSLPSGTATMTVSGGSTVTISGPDARLAVGYVGAVGAPGIGTLNVTGAGSQILMSASDSTRGLVGAGPNTVGVLNVGAGANVVTGNLLGIAHTGEAGTVTSGGVGTLIANGMVGAVNIFVGTGGVVSGSGTLVGNVTNFGVINPGNSPGTMAIAGNFDAGSGVLEIELGGDALFDQLIVSGTATLGGTLRVVPFGGYLPGLGQTFTFLTGNPIAGNFGSYDYTAFGGYSFELISTNTALTLSVAAVPEPSTYAMLLAGLGLLGWMVRRRMAG